MRRMNYAGLTQLLAEFAPKVPISCLRISVCRRCKSTTPRAVSPSRSMVRSTCGWTPPGGGPPPRSCQGSIRTASPGCWARIPTCHAPTSLPAPFSWPTREDRSPRPAHLRPSCVRPSTGTVAFLPAPPNDTVRRVFQALRIAVNDELGSLSALLRSLPSCLKPGGRVAILSFHSGEDRLVKAAFKAGLADGTYARMSSEVIRATPAERRDNPRSSAAKLRFRCPALSDLVASDENRPIDNLRINVLQLSWR